MSAPAPSSRFAPIVRYALRAAADLMRFLLCPWAPRWWRVWSPSTVVYTAAAPTRVQPIAVAATTDPPPVTGASSAPPTRAAPAAAHMPHFFQPGVWWAFLVSSSMLAHLAFGSLGFFGPWT
jgi:hypothetical protein